MLREWSFLAVEVEKCPQFVAVGNVLLLPLLMMVDWRKFLSGLLLSLLAR